MPDLGDLIEAAWERRGELAPGTVDAELEERG